MLECFSLRSVVFSVLTFHDYDTFLTFLSVHRQQNPAGEFYRFSKHQALPKSEAWEDYWEWREKTSNRIKGGISHYRRGPCEEPTPWKRGGNNFPRNERKNNLHIRSFNSNGRCKLNRNSALSLIRYKVTLSCFSSLPPPSSQESGADVAFFQGGFDPTTMRSIVHEPRSGEPIFFGYFEPP